MQIKFKIVYLDANFLVDWFIRKQPDLRKRARALLAHFFSRGIILALSSLTIDEVWKGIKEEIKEEKEITYWDERVFFSLQDFTKKILENPEKIHIIQFQNLQSSIMEALNNIQVFHLQPRDAFHLAIMKDNEIMAIVTRDEKFIKQQSKMGIKVITLKNEKEIKKKN